MALPEGVVGQRPAQPRQELLEAAAAALASQLEISPQPRWEVTQRREHPRSTIFVLQAHHALGQTRAFYKTEHIPPSDRDSQLFLAKVEYRRQAIEGESRLALRLVDMFLPEAIRFDRPLVLRPDLLTGVRLAVPGKKLGRSLWRGLPTRRLRGLHVYEMIGRASRLIEEVGRSLGPPLDERECRRRLDSELDRASSALTPDLRRAVADALERLVARVELPGCFVWTHGDLSPTNILVDRGQVGIIDFSWRPHLMGRDIAQFLHRLHSESFQSRLWTQQATESVLSGYAVDTRSAAWQLARLHRLICNARKPETSVRSTAVRELQTLV